MNTDPGKSERQRLSDELRTKYGDNVAMTFMNSCAQHRLGLPHDAWDWHPVTIADIDMARNLLELLELLRERP